MTAVSRRARLAAALIAGVTPIGVQAQDAGPPAASPTPDGFEIRGADGKPLPPEVQRQLRAQFKDQMPPPAPPPADPQDIVVAAEKPRGSVVGDIPAALTFKPVDIRAYGAGDIRELLQTLGPQVASSRGREAEGPIVLLNGRRVSGDAEIARIPTEAIERMEVFPEELALKYGFPATRKVVNIVTFERFSSQIGQASLAGATEGGRDTPGAIASLLRIRGDTRLSLDADYSRSGALLESERGIRQLDAGPELGRARTLLPGNERFSLTGTVSADVIAGLSSTLNARLGSERNRSLFGIAATGEPLTGTVQTDTRHLGTTLGGRLGKWQWTLTGNLDRTSTGTRIDLAGPAGPIGTEARAVDRTANADLVLGGDLARLPAGPVSVSLRAGADFRDFSSRSTAGGTGGGFDLSRDRGVVQANIDLPVVSRRLGGLAMIGDLSVNANVQLERFSDFGTLRTWGYGLNWTPSPAINLVASASWEEGAPALEQLGAPLVVTPNVRTFDFSRGETVDLTRRIGGNPDLRADERRIASIGLTIKPLAKADLTINLDYLRTRIDNPITAFPIALPEVEAAFPERFARGADGRLLEIDARPVNFARSEQEQLRFGFNFTRPLGTVPPALRDVRVRFVQSEADAQRRLPPGARLAAATPGSPGARLAETLTSRVFVSAYYTLRLEDEIVLRDGGPRLDLLGGGAIDARGGRPRHEIELQAGAYRRGLGVRASASWVSGTTVSGLAGPGREGDLRFSAYGTINLSLFMNVADRFGGPTAPGWMKGVRASLSVVNLLNDRPEVRDRLGMTPINYQPAYLNPVGRLISFSLRKAF